MLDCTDINKLIANEAGERQDFVLLSLLTQWQLDCLKQIEDESREQFPREQEEILFDKIKVQVEIVKNDLIQIAIQDLKFIGVILRDYEVGENVNFNKFLVECLLSSYKSISNEMNRSMKKSFEQKFDDFLQRGPQNELDQHLDSSNKTKIDSYLNIRRDGDSLYKIYYTIGSLAAEEAFEVTYKFLSIEEKRLALQRVFHITGEYVKDTQISPNLLPDVRQSLDEKGVPTKALSKYTDTLVHKQVFPLIKGNDNEVKELFDEYFLLIQKIIKRTIIETEDSFVQNIIEEKGKESKIYESVVERLIKSISREGVEGLNECIREMQSEDKYRSMEDENKKFVDEVYQTVLRMKSMEFRKDLQWSHEWKLSEKEPKPLDSLIEYINQSNLDVYDDLRAVVAPILERHAGGLENPHGDVLKITQVIDRLSYEDTSSPNNSILDNFLSLPILENIYVEIQKGTDNKTVIKSSLKKELERYFDAKSFKNNNAYDFKGHEKNIIRFLNHYNTETSTNIMILIDFFSTIDVGQGYYIPLEKYERLVKGLDIKEYIKEMLLSYSVEWRKKKCVDLLKQNPPALKIIYDRITEGKSIDLSVYHRFAEEYRLSQELPTAVKQRVKGINQKIKDLYSRRVIEEIEVLKNVTHPYAVESQVLNVYSLLEKASDKGKKKEKKRGEKKKGDEENKSEMKNLPNYLAHGDPLISIQNGEYITYQLVAVKNQSKIIDQLIDRTLNFKNIQSAFDDSLSNVRSAGENYLTSEEIDKFNKGGAEYGDPDNIIIDSEKFISSISSELEANEEKFSNFIALASESEVIGDHTSKVNKLTDNHRYLGNLERVGNASDVVMDGMMATTLVDNILHTDVIDLAVNIGSYASIPVLGKAADEASMKGAEYILKGKPWRGGSLTIASPFISSAFSGYTVYDLVDQVKNYREGDKDALVPIIGDSIQIATDVTGIVVTIGESFGFLTGVSAVTSPLGIAIAALVFVGTGAFKAVKTVKKIDAYIHLTGWEKFIEGIYAFFGLPPSDNIEKLLEEKDANNQVVKIATSYLKGNPHIQRYVLPSMKVKYTVSPCPGFFVIFFPICLIAKLLLPKRRMRSNIINILDNVVLLDQKRNDIKWSRIRPDNLEGIDLFCLPKGDWESVPESGTYYCDGAIGVEYTNDRTGNYTLISLGAGKDRIQGFQGSSNIFVIGTGDKDMTGGNNDDYFIFGERSDADSNSEIKGYINGRGGIDIIDVGELTPHYERSKRVGRYHVSADFRKGILKDTSKVALEIYNINVFLGRKGGVDQVVSACDTKYVDGRGGENKNYLDSIIIPKDDACPYDTKVTVNPYTKVTNNAIRGNFLYFVNGEKGKEAYIEFGSSLQSNNTFTFNYTLTDVAAIDKSEKNITFSFVEEFYKREKKTDVNSSFNLTVSGADKNITTYYLIDSTKIVMGQNNVYALQNTDKLIDSLVKDYSSIAHKSQMYVVVHSNDEVLTVGHSHGNVLMNDPNARASHLVGGGGENVFFITSGHEKLTLPKLPISDVVIYDFDQENKIDALYLRKIKEQLKKDIGREINTDVSKIDSDLLINLSLDDASKKEVVKIRLKSALENNWHKRVHIVIDNIFVIEQILDVFKLTPKPLIFDDNSKTIYVINPTDVAEGGNIRVKKEIGDYIFARDNVALVITNSLSSSVDKNNRFTIILNDFYHGHNQDKMQSLKIEFNDKKILLRKEVERINSAGNFSELKRKAKIDSFTAVMYAIKKQKLFEAIEGNNIREVKELINHGVSINARNNGGQTPLHSAAKNGKLEVVKYLIEEKDADFNVRDNSGLTPLHYAALGGDIEVVKYLIEEKNADVNVKSNSGFTPLHYASKGGSLQMVRYLIEEKNAAVHVKDNSGITPLHYAVISGNLEMVKYLIEEKNADVHVKDNSGFTPLHYASKGGSLQMVKYLIEEKNADVHVKDNSGITPLYYAVISGNLEMVKYLIEEKNADVHVKDNSGSMPLKAASDRGHSDIVEYLERKLNAKREKPRQHKRSHHQSSRRLLSTDSSNQPEIATSNASEKSSWINDLFDSVVKLQESSASSEAASNNHPIRHKRRKRHYDHSRYEDGMRMHRVRYRHRRVQKRNVKYQDSHYYIDQPEIATSSGTRPSSWINGLLDWIKEKGGGLVSSVAYKFAAKESDDSQSRGIHACSVRLEKMYSATIPNIPQSRKSQGVPKGNIPNTSWSGWSSSREKVTSNVTDAPEMNTTVLNNVLILGDLAVRLVNGTRHKQPIHENLLSLREKSMRFIDENMIMRTIQQGKEKFGGLDTNMDV